MISFCMTGSARRRVRVGLVSLSTLGACTMDNPAFEESEESVGDGESGASDKGTSATSMDEEGGEGVTSAESEVSSTSGDGDGDGGSESSFDTGDGDGDVSSESFDTGDGDGDGDDGGDGDGDGDGEDDGAMLVCETLVIAATADTFFQNGPVVTNGEGTSCDLDGNSALGPPDDPCSELDFGGVPQHWVGGEGAAESMYAFHIPPDPLGSLPEGAEIEQIRFKVPVLLEATQGVGVTAYLSHITAGDGGQWAAGVGLGDLPEAPNDRVATHKYRNYGMSVTWAGADVGTELNSPIGSVPLIQPPGTSTVSFTIDEIGFGDWVDFALPGAGNGWVLSSNAEPFEFWVDAREGATGGSAAKFEVDYCYFP